MNDTGSTADDDETGSDFLTPGAGTAPADTRRLNDELGLPAGQAIGGLAGDPEDELSDDVESGGP